MNNVLIVKRKQLTPPDTALETAVQQHAQVIGGDIVIAISGRITIDSSPELRLSLLRQLYAPGCQTLTLDFAAVAFADTSALAVLLELLKTARLLSKPFRLSNLPEGPRYLLEATRLLHLFEEVHQDAPPC